MIKTDYTHSPKKRVVQSLVFKQAIKGKNKLIGLAGPNINNYLKFIKQMGIQVVDIYESHPMQLLLQMLDYKASFNVKTRVQNTDIYNAPANEKDTLYDLDFDCSILLVKKHIKKFIENSIITLAIRPVGVQKTLSIFSKLVSREKPHIELNVQNTKDYTLHKVVFPSKTYLCYQYRDKSNMITITRQNFKDEKND